MGRVYKRQARKKYRCHRCGREILPGYYYYRVEINYYGTKTYCTFCPPRKSDLTYARYGNYYYAQELVEDAWRHVEAGNMEVDEFIDKVEEAKDIVSSTIDEYQESYDNLEYYSPNHPNLDIIQHYIDAGDSLLEKLEELLGDLEEYQNIRKQLEEKLGENWEEIVENNEVPEEIEEEVEDLIFDLNDTWRRIGDIVDEVINWDEV